MSTYLVTSYRYGEGGGVTGRARVEAPHEARAIGIAMSARLRRQAESGDSLTACEIGEVEEDEALD